MQEQQYDPEEIIEQLAAQFGCSNGSCGYDFDSECYWWLQGKVQAEIEQREREARSFQYKPGFFSQSPGGFRGGRKFSWSEENKDPNVQQFAKKAREAFRESFADVYNSNPNHQFRIRIGTNNIFFNRGAVGDQLFQELNELLKTGFCKGWERTYGSAPVSVMVEMPTQSPDPFADGIDNMRQIHLQNMDIMLHGGYFHGKIVHIDGPVYATYMIPVIKPNQIKWDYMEGPDQLTGARFDMVQDRYQLVLINGVEPHYFYIPRV